MVWKNHFMSHRYSFGELSESLWYSYTITMYLVYHNHFETIVHIPASKHCQKQYVVVLYHKQEVRNSTQNPFINMVVRDHLK